MRSSNAKLTKVEGEMEDVIFTITGPPEKVKSIVTYIRNLTNLMANKHI